MLVKNEELTKEFFGKELNIETLKKLGYKQQVGTRTIKGTPKGEQSWAMKIIPTDSGCQEVWLVFAIELTPQNTIETISATVRFVFDNGKTEDMDLKYFPSVAIEDIGNEIKCALATVAKSAREITGSKLLKSFVKNKWESGSGDQYHCEIKNDIWNRDSNGDGYKYFTTVASSERKQLSIVITISADKKGLVESFEVEAFYDQGVFSRPHYTETTELEELRAEEYMRELLEA